MVKINKTLLLAALLFVMLLAGFVLRNFPFSQGNFDDTRPAIMTSTDVAYFTWKAVSSYRSEMPAIEPSYTTSGVENVLSGYPSLMNTFVGSFGKLTNLNPYQLTFILMCLLTALVPLYGFIIVRRYFGTEPAIIVLVLATFASATIIFPVYLGFWADLYSYPAAICAIFFIKELWGKRRILPIFLFGAMSSAGLVGHAFEFMYALFTICLTLLVVGVGLVKERKLALRNLALLILFVALFSSLYIFRFDILSMGTSNTFKLGEVRSAPLDYFRIIYPSAWFFIGTGLGAIAIIYLTLKKRFGLYQWAIISFTLFLVFLLYSRYIGIEAHQTYRQLYHGYFLHLLPLAIGLSALAGTIRQSVKQRWIVGAGLGVLLVVASLMTAVPAYKEMAQIDQSTLPKNSEFDSLAWVRDNTPADSKILIFFGLYGQGFDILSERMSTWYPHDETLLQQVCSGIIPEEYKSTFRYYMFSKEGRFKILNEDFTTSYYYPNVSTEPLKLQDFDYVLARYTGTEVDPCIQFYLSNLINQSNEVVWADDYVAVIRVNKDGY